MPGLGSYTPRAGGFNSGQEVQYQFAIYHRAHEEEIDGAIENHLRKGRHEKA